MITRNSLLAVHSFCFAVQDDADVATRAIPELTRLLNDNDPVRITLFVTNLCKLIMPDYTVISNTSLYQLHLIIPITPHHTSYTSYTSYTS